MHAAHQRADELALLCEAALILLGGQAAAEAALEVRAPAGLGGSTEAGRSMNRGTARSAFQARNIGE